MQRNRSYIHNMDKIPLIETESRDESIELVDKDNKTAIINILQLLKR